MTLSAASRPSDPRDEVKKLPPSRQTQFVNDFYEATDFMLSAEESLIKCREGRIDNPDQDCLECFDNLNACACIALSLPILTDMRLPVDEHVFQNLPGSPMAFHITWNALEDENPQILDLEAPHFLVLLVDAIGLYICRKDMLGQARRIINELDIQIEGDVIDWDEIEADDELYCSLKEEDLVFAVATVGVEVNRQLYRRPPSEREHLPIPPPTDTQLLEDCRRFAQRQYRERPESPVGSMNLGWVELESRNVAQAHHWYETSVKKADAAGYDIISCTARIELALTTIMGSGRFAPGMLIQRKQVQDLYDEFLLGCQGLEDWHMAEFAQREPAGEDIVKGYLKRYSSEMTPAEDPRTLFQSYRDPGPKTRMCDGCGNQCKKVKKCAGCKRTAYCSKECHVKHWKAGHRKECDYRKRKTAPETKKGE